MNCDDCRVCLPELWEGLLDAEKRSQVEAHLAACPRCKNEANQLADLWNGLGQLPFPQPGSRVRLRFYERLAAYQDGFEGGRTGSRFCLPPAFRIAAGVMVLIAGFGAGFWLDSTRDRQQLTQLRSEVTNMRQLVTLSLLQQQSASERLRGVNWAYRSEPPGSEVLAALLGAVDHDPSVDVRLAAVDALRSFADDPSARQGLRQALTKQDSPLVQIALIDQMAELRDHAAVPSLTSLLNEPKISREVRQRAEWALGRIP